jgi:hypothetical protein
MVRRYFGCLACPANRTCPPPQGWPVGERVPVRELMGLTSPWYFNAVPTDVQVRSDDAFRQIFVSRASVTSAWIALEKGRKVGVFERFSILPG